MDSIWRQRGVRPLLWMTFTGFVGYAVLLPVAPLWVVHGGADVGRSGLVNGVMLTATVLTQLSMPVALRHLGWRAVLVAGMALLGIPGLLHLLGDQFFLVLGLAVLRGMGFGVLTVVGSSAAAALVDPERRGEAIGAYGLAVMLPNVLLLPAAPWVADQVGFWLVFVVAAAPLLGIPAAVRVAALLDEEAPDLLDPDEAAHRPLEVYARLLRPAVLLLVATLVGGALITFVPQMVTSGVLATAGLLVMGLVSALSRWRVGRLADRYGVQRFLWPMVVATATGTALVAWAVVDAADTHAWLFLAGMAAAGIGNGALQNLTLVSAFDTAERRDHNVVSAGWNIGFDAGTALGSVGVGLIAATWSFGTAFTAVAVLVVLVLPVAIADPARR